MMSELSSPSEFAIKWLEKFKNPLTEYRELIGIEFSKDCEMLGFKMDSGYSFYTAYGEAAFNVEKLDAIIDQVDDIYLLGSAIYSRWRYFNHWAYEGKEITQAENRAWFIVALHRLAALSGAGPVVFCGEIKKLHLISNAYTGAAPLYGAQEMEQRITIDTEGQVDFAAYNCIAMGEDGECLRQESFVIAPAEAKRLLTAIAAYFSECYEVVYAFDTGQWMLELTNTDGETFCVQGSLCNEFLADGIDLSDLLRETLDRYDLYAFDGKKRSDIITRVSLHYQKGVKATSVENRTDGNRDIPVDYEEEVVVDRATGTLSVVQKQAPDKVIERRYQLKDRVAQLLNEFDEQSFMLHGAETPNDFAEDPEDIQTYKLVIAYRDGASRTLTGCFDKYGLPDDYDIFASAVYSFLQYYKEAEVLQPYVYGRRRRRKSDYIFLSVVFPNSYKTYYYLTDDGQIEIGDEVIVPAGKNNRSEIVTVVDIDYFSEEEAPMPLEQIKSIIGKYDGEDIG